MIKLTLQSSIHIDIRKYYIYRPPALPPVPLPACLLIPLANSRRCFTLLRIFGYSMALFGVRRGSKMILSQIPLTSLNMSSYGAIWILFGPNFIFFEPKISDPGPKILILVPKISYHGSIELFGGLTPCIPRGSASRAFRFSWNLDLGSP